MPRALRNSRYSDAQIAAAVAGNPFQITPEGNLQTCPVRLGYQAVFKTSKPQRGDDGVMKEGRYEIEMLTPTALQEMSLVENLWKEQVKVHHPSFLSNPNPAGGFFGLEYPFSDQARKADKPGYTPGLIYFKATTKIQPRVLYADGRTITDEKELYSGVWVIAVLNTWQYKNLKKGVSFGIQTLVKYADDEVTYTGGIDHGAVVGRINVNAGFFSGMSAAPVAVGGVMPNSYGAAPPPGSYPPPGGFQPVRQGTPGVDY